MSLNIHIQEFSPALKDNFLSFFDCDAFADNPRWASCYCFFNQAPHKTEDWAQRTAGQNRAATIQLIDSGQMCGYLAYADEKPVGWCNANLKVRYTTLENENDQAEVVGAIVCFIVAKAYRGQGVATRLLAAACDGLGKMGATIIEAYPRKDATAEGANYHGPLQMYLKAGFDRVNEVDGVVIVRKETPAARG